MSTINSYMFNNMGRIGQDVTDQTQQNVHNTRFGNYTLSNYFSESVSDSQIQFATAQSGIMLNAVSGVANSVVDVHSYLLNNKESERPLEKLQLSQRPFITVPYLGKGSGDPTLESQLQQGEIVSDRKSVSTISETSYVNYSSYPMQDDIKSRVTNPVYSVEESALDGWVRGGASTRDFTNNSSFSKNYRNTDSSF